jgi:putative phosphoribosyl transferase
MRTPGHYERSFVAPAKELPSRPNLEQYKKQAKDLIKQLANASPEALMRVRHHHPRMRDLERFDAPIQLADAQLVIAREHSFETWAAFASHVRSLQDAARLSIERISAEGAQLVVDIGAPEHAIGLVLFACASSYSRNNPRNLYFADVLKRGKLCTIIADLLTEDEEVKDINEDLQFDLHLLSRRIVAITDWIVQRASLRELPIGYCASGTAAAAALAAATERSNIVRAVVSSGGRPDLAGPWLGRVHAPTLLTVGGKDTLGLGFNYSSMTPFPRETVVGFERIDGAGGYLEEEGALEKSASLALDWFSRYLSGRKSDEQ